MLDMCVCARTYRVSIGHREFGQGVCWMRFGCDMECGCCFAYPRLREPLDQSHKYPRGRMGVRGRVRLALSLSPLVTGRLAQNGI